MWIDNTEVEGIGGPEQPKPSKGELIGYLPSKDGGQINRLASTVQNYD